MKGSQRKLDHTHIDEAFSRPLTHQTVKRCFDSYANPAKTSNEESLEHKMMLKIVQADISSGKL